MIVDRDYLGEVSVRLGRRDCRQVHWIEFCEAMLERGYTVELRESRGSMSKYVTIWNLGRKRVVRFSDHAATKKNRDPVASFVGPDSCVEEVIEEVVKTLGRSPFARGGRESC